MKYTFGDVERITGVQRLRLHHWMKEGFLIPSGQVARGSGTKNIYTDEDIYKIKLLKKLLEAGIHGKLAKLLTSSDQGIGTAEKLLKDIEALSLWSPTRWRKTP